MTTKVDLKKMPTIEIAGIQRSFKYYFNTLTQPYSLFKDFTGFINAALILWKLIVNNAMKIDISAANAKTHQLISVWYAKSCNQVFIAYQAMGDAMTMAIRTSLRKSLESRITRLATDAPNTLRTPISFVLISAINMDRPSKPRHDIKIAIPANIPKSICWVCSLAYSCPNF